jgi:hypothetical protein
MEAFLSRLMDENDVPNDLMDEENYLYDSEGRAPTFPLAFFLMS